MDVFAVVVSESSLADMKQVLLLLLGCAVQSLQKENYVNTIKQLDIHTQEVIVEHIKQVRTYDGQNQNRMHLNSRFLVQGIP